MSGDDAERGDHGGVGRGAGSLVSDGLFSSGQCAGRWSTAGLGLDSSAPARLARGPGWSARGSRPRGYLDRVSDAQWRRQAINTDTSFQVTRTARQPVVNHSVYAMDDHGRFPKLADNFLQMSINKLVVIGRHGPGWPQTWKT